MINLRYHIVSITAVFLALGIGLTLGTSFLDRVTVDTLKQQLDDVEARVEATDAENALLSDELDRRLQQDEALSFGLGRLVEGALEEVPVLVVATEGTSEDRVEQAIAVLGSSGADVAGTWWLTDRWELDDEGEVADLAAALEIDSDDPQRLFRAAASRLGIILGDAASAAEAPAADEGAAAPEGAGEGAGEGEDGEGPAPIEPFEPELAAALSAAGFLEYVPLPGSGDERVLLPGTGVRYLMVSEAPVGAGQQRAVGTILTTMVDDDGIVPVLAAQGDTELEDAEGEPAPEGERRTTFVGPLREDERLRSSISTLDDLDTAPGLMSVVLALDDLGEDRIGHYGIAPGATALIPGAPAP